MAFRARRRYDSHMADGNGAQAAPGASPPRAPAPPEEPRADERRTLTVREVMAEVTQRLVDILDQYRDDTYNVAVIANPLALAVSFGRETEVAVADATPTLVFANSELRVPVMVVVTGDNTAHDVSGVQAAGTAGHPQLTMPQTFTALVRPGQELWVSLFATTYAGATLYVTAVPLRGRATVFGG